jgi:type II secretory pathway component PulC
MAVFYNSSAAIQTVSVTNLTIGGMSATTSITGTAQSANTGAIVVTANSTTGANLFSRLVFTNSNGMTFGVSTAANSVVLTVSTAGAIVVSGGTTSGTISTLVFTNANSVSFGMATAANSIGSATITASYTAPAAESYFNYPVGPFLGSTFTNLNLGSTNILQPFNLPYAVSFNCIRMPYHKPHLRMVQEDLCKQQDYMQTYIQWVPVRNPLLYY